MLLKGGSPLGVWGGRWTGLGSVVWEAPRGRALGGRRVGVWLGDTRLDALVGTGPPTASGSGAGGFWGGGGEIPRKEQTCVGEREKSWGAMGRPGTRHPKFPREPSWGSALSPSVSRHRAPATLLTQGIRLCLSFPSLHGWEGGEQCVPPSLGTPGSWPALWSRGHRDSARGWHTWPGVAPGAPPRWHRDPLPSPSPHGVMGASSCLRPPVVRPFPPPPKFVLARKPVSASLCLFPWLFGVGFFFFF